ncbi:MAG TPA: hypothetical protein DCS55_01310 [Acidimicrobiaceae bacterium]|nr:hypothetical protein [Acidimicrobiaceae bacterium]|tara:strand:- start:648 stop:920 length:273 start_codon:yes stop_codon:yes gene_type:complete
MDLDETDEGALRRELAMLDANLAAIPTDQFAERSPLLKRRDEVTASLRAAVATDREILERWADRAGRKETGDGSKPYIPSRGEGGDAGAR